MDFARNEISDLSFICLDPVFFTDDYKASETLSVKKSEDNEETKEDKKKDLDAA